AVSQQHLIAALWASRALFLWRAAETIRGVQADRGLGSQGTRLWPDLVQQKLPDLAIRQSRESLCQRGGDQHGGGEPLHWVAGAQAPPLLFNQFRDRQSLSPSKGYGAVGWIGRRLRVHQRLFLTKLLASHLCWIIRILIKGEQWRSAMTFPIRDACRCGPRRRGSGTFPR